MAATNNRTSYRKVGTAVAAGSPGQNIKLVNRVSGSAPGSTLTLYQYAGGGAAGMSRSMLK